MGLRAVCGIFLLAGCILAAGAAGPPGPPGMQRPGESELGAACTSPPGEARDLAFTSDSRTLTWLPPVDTGGGSVVYDAIRSTSPPRTCDAATGSCRTSCATSADCAPGFGCRTATGASAWLASRVRPGPNASPMPAAAGSAGTPPTMSPTAAPAASSARTRTARPPAPRASASLSAIPDGGTAMELAGW